MEKKLKMNKEDFYLWTVFRKKNTSTASQKDVKLICSLHAKYFNHSYYIPCTCSASTYNLWIEHLNELYSRGSEQNT